MKKLSLIILFPFIIAIAACSKTPEPGIVLQGKLWGSIYQQQAAEYNALSFQAYNIARMRIDQSLQATSDKPKAIISDIDETILNNSPSTAFDALHGKTFNPEDWAKWVNQSRATALAGAVAFFKYANAHQIEIFYITNREEPLKAATIKNLQLQGFPLADETHVIMHAPDTPQSKEGRRQEIASKYNIVLLLGDNLSDFSALFDDKTTAQRAQNVDTSSEEFGNRFIILPNPTYGSWEDALYQYKNLSVGQKDAILKQTVQQIPKTN